MSCPGIALTCATARGDTFTLRCFHRGSDDGVAVALVVEGHEVVLESGEARRFAQLLAAAADDLDPHAAAVRRRVPWRRFGGITR